MSILRLFTLGMQDLVDGSVNSSITTLWSLVLVGTTRTLSMTLVVKKLSIDLSFRVVAVIPRMNVETRQYI